MSAKTCVVLDFETSGLSPDWGDRAIEIGAVKYLGGLKIDQFSALINPGFKVTRFIEDYTGITNAMLTAADSAEKVMAAFAGFIEGFNLVAHNVSFDKKFLDHEFSVAGLSYSGQFACSLLNARRLYPQASGYSLSKLVSHMQLENEGVFHRALADATLTGRLWLKLIECIESQYGFTPTFEQMRKVQSTPKAKVDNLLNKMTAKAVCNI